jgi:F-type H+-transporting ATPase subunit a
MQLFGLLTGLVQAYIFAVLAAVYIAAGTEVQERRAAAVQPAPPPAKPNKENS